MGLFRRNAPPPPPIQFVPATWLQWPTLSFWGHNKVVGESYRQQALADIQPGPPGGDLTRRVTAQLVPEPRNPHDPNAISVVVGGQLVGYIPRDQTSRWHGVIADLARTGKPATARAVCTGGEWQTDGSRHSFGIMLEATPMPIPTGQWWLPDGQVMNSLWFLPEGRSVAVTDTKHHQEPLVALLGDRDTTVYVCQLGEDDDRRVTVSVDGTQIGRLTAATSAKYTRLLADVHAAGMPATAKLSVSRKTPDEVGANLDLGR